MARLVSGILLAVLLFLLLALTGCGTIHVNLHTTVEPSGDIIQQLEFEGSGMMGGFFASPDAAQEFKAAGWQTSIKRLGDSVCLTATRTFKQGEAISIPSMPGGDEETALENMNFHVRNLIVVKEYFFEVTLPGTSISNETMGDGVYDEFAELGEAMLNSMFSMSWTLSLPGDIVETNADALEDNTATWYFTIDSLERDRYMMLRTRYIDWLMIAVIGGSAALVILLLVVLARPKLYSAAKPRQQGDQQWMWGTQGVFPCSRCGSQNVTGQQFCVACGQKLQYNCPSCRATVVFGSSLCPNCGMRLNWGSQQASTCPKCGATITVGSNPCPNCGTRLDWRM